MSGIVGVLSALGALGAFSVLAWFPSRCPWCCVLGVVGLGVACALGVLDPLGVPWCP